MIHLKQHEPQNVRMKANLFRARTTYSSLHPLPLIDPLLADVPNRLSTLSLWFFDWLCAISSAFLPYKQNPTESCFSSSFKWYWELTVSTNNKRQTLYHSEKPDNFIQLSWPCWRQIMWWLILLTFKVHVLLWSRLTQSSKWWWQMEMALVIHHRYSQDLRVIIFDLGVICLTWHCMKVTTYEVAVLLSKLAKLLCKNTFLSYYLWLMILGCRHTEILLLFTLGWLMLP